MKLVVFITNIFFWTQCFNGFTTGSCPDANGIAPCSCVQDTTLATDIEGETFVTCFDIEKASVLFNAARGTTSKLVHKFRVFNSRMGYLPSNMFVGTVVTSIQVFHSPISHFTEGNETAFLGLENHLRELVLSNCQINDSAKFETFSKLNELHTLDLSFNKIINVSNKWFFHPPKNLEILNLKRNMIENIEDMAFAYISKLRSLDLSENRLTTIQRTILPPQVLNLTHLYFSYNDLVSVSKDFFNEMPNIQKVYLDYNHIRSLTETPFGELWNKKWNRYLSHVDFLGNDIMCDVSLCWFSLLVEKDRNAATGSCSDPDRLRGRRLRTLWPWDLNCNETIYKGDLKLSYRAKL